MKKYEMCSCGHLGGQNCEGRHDDYFQKGHGGCTLCECNKFTWVGYCDADGSPKSN